MLGLVFVLPIVGGCGGKTVHGDWDLVCNSEDPKIAQRLREVGDFEKTFRFEEYGGFWFTYGGQDATGRYQVQGTTITLSGEGSDGGTKEDILTWEKATDKISGRIGKLDATLTRAD